MNASKGLKIGALVCFVLATFGIALGAVTLVPLGLALYVAGDLI